MYQQQLVHLPRTVKRKTLNSIYKTLYERLKPVKIAAIIHDKDVDDSGELIEKHVHVVMQFENQRSLDNLAKLMEEPQVSAFQHWRGNVNNAYSYLIHKTTEAENKFQYELEDVKANFDYSKLMNEVERKVESKSRLKDSEIIKNLLDQLGVGELTKEEVIENLTGSQYAKAKRQINDVHQQVQEQKMKEWVQQRKDSEQPLEVIWIYGGAGTGKTAIAKRQVKELGEKYFISGSSKDSFQYYDGEHLVILDELRPTTFKYDDLLKILDPFAENPKAPSRFYDKPLMIETLIITSPYNPRQFYDEIFGDKKTIDSFEQLKRRITFVQYVTKEHIELHDYNEVEKRYIYVDGTRKNNSELESLSKKKTIKAIDAYNKFNRILEESD